MYCKRSRLHRNGNKTCDFVPENTSAKQWPRTLAKEHQTCTWAWLQDRGGGGGTIQERACDGLFLLANAWLFSCTTSVREKHYQKSALYSISARPLLVSLSTTYSPFIGNWHPNFLVSLSHSCRYRENNSTSCIV